MGPLFLTPMYWLGIFAVLWWLSDSWERVERTLIAILVFGIIGYLTFMFLVTFNDKKHKAKSKLKRFTVAVAAIFQGIYVLLWLCALMLFWFGITRVV